MKQAILLNNKGYLIPFSKVKQKFKESLELKDEIKITSMNCSDKDSIEIIYKDNIIIKNNFLIVQGKSNICYIPKKEFAKLFNIKDDFTRIRKITPTEEKNKYIKKYFDQTVSEEDHLFFEIEKPDYVYITELES